MRKQRVPRYLLVLCLLLIVANFSGCAAPTAADSLSQSTANASQADDSLIPGPSQELPSDSPQGQWQSLDAAQSSQSDALSADSDMLQQETDEDAQRFAADVPQDIRRRILEAEETGHIQHDLTDMSFEECCREEISHLDLTGLTFAERCQLVIQWTVVHIPFYSTLGIGMIDLTLDGHAEFILQYFSPAGHCVDIFDLTGDRVQSIVYLHQLAGNAGADTWKRESARLQGKAWCVFSTVFPDGTPGGIVERTTNKTMMTVTYYTFDEKYSLENPLIVQGTFF